MRTLYCLITLLIVAASPLTFMNCEWPEETRLRGQVYDSVKQVMLEDVNVILWSCQKSFSSAGITCNTIVDSVRTNSRGRYLMHFLPDQTTDEYMVAIENDKSFHSMERKKVRAGVENFVTIYARQANYLKVKLTINNNSVGPITMETALGNEVLIPQHIRDTVIYGRVMPNTRNHSIVFRVYDDGLQDTRMSEAFLNIDLRDTTYFEMNIADPAAWAVPDGP